ncbi:MAG: hypothetical protein RL139_1017 [Gemmatimonadota bacterium]
MGARRVAEDGRTMRRWMRGMRVGLLLGLPAVGAGAQEGAGMSGLPRAVLAAVDSGQFAAPERRTRLYATAQRLADSAVRISPRSADAHAVRAIALGRSALALGPAERTRYAVEVRREALAALALDPDHAGALHVLGMWHAEVLRLNPVARLAARTVLGGAVFSEASWTVAQRSLERAVALEPTRLTHRLDLAGILADRGDAAGARAQYAWIVAATPREYNDAQYQRLAAARRGTP